LVNRDQSGGVVLRWDDLASLEQLRRNIDIATAIMGILVAILIVFSRWPLANRISQLQSEQKAALQRQIASLQDRVAPHALTPEQLDRLRELLQPAARDVTVEILTHPRQPGVTEVSDLLASQLATAFREHGWQVSFGHTLGMPPRGLIVNLVTKVETHEGLPPDLQAIWAIFSPLRIPAAGSTTYDPSAPSTHLQITVGTNPF
jgi:hypothetical protein